MREMSLLELRYFTYTNDSLQPYGDILFTSIYKYKQLISRPIIEDTVIQREENIICEYNKKQYVNLLYVTQIYLILIFFYL